MSMGMSCGKLVVAVTLLALIAVACDFESNTGSTRTPTLVPESGWTTYDGDLVCDLVFSIAPAPGGAVWIGTGGGLSRFDGSTWTSYDYEDGLPVSPDFCDEPGPDCAMSMVCDGPGGQAVEAVAVAPDGMLWLGTEGGVTQFDGNTWTTYPDDDGNLVLTDTLAVAPDGTVWALIRDAEGKAEKLLRLDGDAWTTYTAEDGLPSSYASSMAIDPEGAVWIATGDGLSRFDGELWTSWTTDDGLPDNFVDSLTVAPDGKVWMDTADPGGGHFSLSCFDGDTWNIVTTEDGLPSDFFGGVAAAPDGTIWVGTWPEFGVARFDGDAWTTYTADNAIDCPPLFLTAGDDGSVWVRGAGQCGGVSRFVPGD